MQYDQPQVHSGSKQLHAVTTFQRIISIVEGVDIYGFPVQLRLKRQTHHTTVYGGTITLVMVAITLTYLQSLTYNLIYRKEPQILTSILFNESPEIEQLSMEKFFFAFAIQDRNTFVEFQDDTLFKVNIRACSKIKTFNTKSNEYEDIYDCQILPIQRCNYSDHIRIHGIKTFFSKLNMSNFFCVDSKYWDSNPPVIQGTFDNDDFKWISIITTICNNATSNVTCKPLEVIREKLGAGFFEVFLSDQLADYTLPHNPYSYIGRSIFDSFSFSQTKEFTMYFRQMFTQSDDGLLLTSNKYLAQSLNSNFQSDQFLNVVLRLETKKDSTNRNFAKIQDIFGIVGGFWKCLTLLGVAIVTPINKLDFQLKLVNSLFNFEVLERAQRRRIYYERKSNTLKQSDIFKESPNSPRDDKKSKEKRNAKIRLTSHVTSALRDYIQNKDILISNPNTGVEKRRQTSREVRDFLKLKVGKMKLKAEEYIYYFFSCFSTVKAQRNQLQFAMKKLEKDLDIVNILRKFTELEKLKMLILTQEQLQLFDYLPRPCIPMEKNGTLIKQKYDALLLDSMDKKMKFWTTLHEKKSTKQKAMEAYEAYEKIHKLRQISKIDEKLILFLDPNIRQLFESLYQQDNNQEKISPCTSDNNNQINFVLEIDDHNFDLDDIDEEGIGPRLPKLPKNFLKQ